MRMSLPPTRTRVKRRAEVRSYVVAIYSEFRYRGGLVNHNHTEYTSSNKLLQQKTQRGGRTDVLFGLWHSSCNPVVGRRSHKEFLWKIYYGYS